MKKNEKGVYFHLPSFLKDEIKLHCATKGINIKSFLIDVIKKALGLND